MKKIFVLTACLFLFAGLAFADETIPPTPKPTAKTKKTEEFPGKLYIRVRSEAKQPTLTVNRRTLKRLRAALDEADDSPNLAGGAGFNFSRTQTVFGGLFFSLAFVTGGVWLFRAKEKPSKTAMSIVGLAVCGACAAVIFANTPPPSVVSLNSGIFDKSTRAYGWAEGDVKIRVSDDTRDNSDFYLEIPKGGRDNDSEE